MDDFETYDAVVIGGGIAGLSAALVLGRARRRVLVIDAGTPRNAPADAAYGFPTRDGATPEHLVGLGRAELEPYGVHFLDGVIDGAEERADLWTVTTTDGETARGRHLILASGLRDPRRSPAHGRHGAAVCCSVRTATAGRSGTRHSA